MAISVAIVGLNGALGAATLDAFQADIFKNTFAHPILAVSRGIENKSSEVVKYVQADVGKEWQKVAATIKGVDVLIALTNPNSDTFSGLEALAAEIKPKLYIPSQFGVDISKADQVLPGFLGFKSAHSQKVRDSGVATVDVVTSLFAGGPWLYERIAHVGANPGDKSVTYLGSPDVPITYTNIKDIGLVVAAVAAKAHQEVPSLVRVQSGVVTPRKVVEQFEKSHGVSLTVKDTVPKEKVLEEARASWESPDYSRFTYWLNVLISQGGDNGVYFEDNDNELLNPNETLWKWSSF